MIQLKPRLSEKSYALSQGVNTYVFDVPLKSNRLEIKQAIEAQFKVAVTGVNVLRKIGKVKRSVRKRHQPVFGREAASKRAYVTLKKGDKITLFEEA